MEISARRRTSSFFEIIAAEVKMLFVTVGTEFDMGLRNDVTAMT